MSRFSTDSAPESRVLASRTRLEVREPGRRALEPTGTSRSKVRKVSRERERWEGQLFAASDATLGGHPATSNPDFTAEPAEATSEASLPDPSLSGLEHVVLVMLENRSFDHFLGWLPGADGRQAGLSYADNSGTSHSTWPLAPDYQGCAHPDPDHSYAGGRVEYASGACDGWLRAGSNDVFSIGYYTQRDLAFLGQQAPLWTACDHYFAAIMAETYPNRIYQHAAQTDRIRNTNTISTLPTIWDNLAAKGLAGRYYFSDVPFLALWGVKYLPISRPFSVFLADCASGNLPHVAFVDPRFLGEASGTSDDDHPHADIRDGEAFLDLVYNAITTGPAWSKTLLVINFDEWGGFFDHVPPSAAPLPHADQVAGNADGLRGFRVPCLAISPWSRRGYVSHATLDHTSVLKLIEWRWELPPLSVRDQTATNLAVALDFEHPDLQAPRPVVPAGPFGVPCPSATPSTRSALGAAGGRRGELLNIARQVGWPQ
jgi:phospholipase C